MKTNVLILLLSIILSSVWLFIQGGIFVEGLGLIMALMFSLWLLSLKLKDSSIVDIFWGPGFVVMVWFYYWTAPIENHIPLLFSVLVSLWGLRLGIYLFIRNWGKGEDKRYQAFRKEGGDNYWWISLFRVFILQGMILWVLSSLFYGVMANSVGHKFQILHVIGILLWGIGFLWESISDYQMMRFKRNPRNQGKVLSTGLWKYSRHPNYFGDALLWWGYYFFALAVGAWSFIFSPLIMSFLLMKISGVPLLESDLKKSKSNYADYIQHTSAFFPRNPKEKN